MALQPIPGFQHFTTQHCVTGSLCHIYAFYGYPVSEEMLLGLGSGVGFVYWHTRGALPFLGGRANIERPGEEGLEKTAGRRTGVRVDSFRTGSAAKAEKTLLELLTGGQPVMLLVDMGYLPYFDFGEEEFHFGYHAVVACGYDTETKEILLADRDESLHAVSLEALRHARGSTYPPFPPRHAWYRFDFSQARPAGIPAGIPAAGGEIREAISGCVKGMLEPPITNLGVKGIRKAAQRIRKWPEAMEAEELRAACINACIMIDARSGTGGGLFRYMYGRFLEEAAGLTGEPGLSEAGQAFRTAGDCWQQVAALFEQAYAAARPAEVLETICTILPELAGQEERAWSRLGELMREY